MSAPVPSPIKKVDLARTSHFYLSCLEEKTRPALQAKQPPKSFSGFCGLASDLQKGTSSQTPSQSCPACVHYQCP